MILGLTGLNCSGKDAVAKYLVENKGFLHFSLSDELRRMLRAIGIKPSREKLIAFGKKLREEKGNQELAQRALKRVKKGKNYVFTSIRHPEEVRRLRRDKDFTLVNVWAPQKVRFKRSLARKRPGEPKTFRKFLEIERKEFNTKGSSQQLKKVEGMADVKILNDTNNLKKLHARIDRLLRSLERQ
jgi:dephospho-CoA kinase